jgi:hypothetical protein
MAASHIAGQMRVLLQGQKSKLYYVGSMEWNADANQARDFVEVEPAIRFAQEKDMPDMQIVLSYDDPFCNLALPIRNTYSVTDRMRLPELFTRLFTSKERKLFVSLILGCYAQSIRSPRV